MFFHPSSRVRETTGELESVMVWRGEYSLTDRPLLLVKYIELDILEKKKNIPISRGLYFAH